MFYNPEYPKIPNVPSQTGAATFCLQMSPKASLSIPIKIVFQSEPSSVLLTVTLITHVVHPLIWN